jgi:biotin operon repressor
MSIKLQSMAWDTSLPTNEKVILALMCDFADDNGLSCFPSRDTLARKYGSSKRTIQRLIAKLEERGLLIPTKHQKGGSSRDNKGYTVHYAINVEMLKGDNLSRLEPAPKDDKLSPLTGVKGDTGDIPRVTNKQG